MQKISYFLFFRGLPQGEGLLPSRKIHSLRKDWRLSFKSNPQLINRTPKMASSTHGNMETYNPSINLQITYIITPTIFTQMHYSFLLTFYMIFCHRVMILILLYTANKRICILYLFISPDTCKFTSFRVIKSVFSWFSHIPGV